MIPQVNDVGSWVTWIAVVAGSVTTAWAISQTKALAALRGDRDDWKERVTLRDIELKDASAQIADLSDKLSKRPDISYILQSQKEERDQAGKRHEQILAEFKSQMDLTNRRQEQFHEGQLKALTCIQEGLGAANTALTELAADMRSSHRPQTARTRRTDVKK